MTLVQQALNDAHLDKSDIDHVLLVGGSSRIFEIQQQLKQFFSAGKINNSIHPDEAVAHGAGIFHCFQLLLEIISMTYVCQPYALMLVGVSIK